MVWTCNTITLGMVHLVFRKIVPTLFRFYTHTRTLLLVTELLCAKWDVKWCWATQYISTVLQMKAKLHKIRYTVQGYTNLSYIFGKLLKLRHSIFFFKAFFVKFGWSVIRPSNHFIPKNEMIRWPTCHLPTYPATCVHCARALIANVFQKARPSYC